MQLNLPDYSYLAATAIASAVLAFILSTRSTIQRFGGTYGQVMLWCWGQILLVLIPIGIYAATSWSKGGWSKLFQSPELSMAAGTIFLMAALELTSGLALQRNYPVNRFAVTVLAKWTLIFLCLSVVTVVLAYQASELSALEVAWQCLLLALSIPTFFATAGVVRLIEVGYVPHRRAA